MTHVNRRRCVILWRSFLSATVEVMPLFAAVILSEKRNRNPRVIEGSKRR